MIQRPSRLLVSTRNPGKLAEIQEILGPAGIRVVSPEELGWDEEVPEEGETLAENALAKARAASRATGEASLGDDTGLFVDALSGAPGVHSARYAGPDADPGANCAKLLRALVENPPGQRRAEFRCVMALSWPDGAEKCFEGRVEGRISEGLQGVSGFGYDPLFEVEGRTFAEMTSEEKNHLSHRARALAELRSYLEQLPE